MLALALAGSKHNETWLPLVSVVVTSEQDLDDLRETLQSCAAQTYPYIELVVVSPFSADEVGPFAGDRVTHWIHSQGASLGTRRNLGLAAVAGELVHFLDTGHRLTPDAIARKVEAFVEIPDARVCYSHCRLENHAASDRDWQTPFDHPNSYLGDPMLAAVTRHPFTMNAVMLPRWFLCDVGDHEVDLRGWDDVRFAFRMARSSPKAIAIAEPTSVRVRPVAVAGRNLMEEGRYAVEADLRSIEDLLSQPRCYRYVPPLLTRATWFLGTALAAGLPKATYERYHGKLLDIESRVGDGIPSAAGLTALLLDQSLLSIRRQAEGSELGQATYPYLKEREERILHRLAELDHVSGADLRRWLPDLPPRPFAELEHSDRVALAFALGQLQSATLLGPLDIPLRTLVRVGKDYPGHPHEEDWNGLARLARVLGDENAKRMYRQRLVRYGWNWLGSASRIFARSEAA
jgi:hypothetical protein